MKFACEQCKTKYSIADERVRGKVLKIRCKNCGHIITVREESVPRGKEKGVLERAMEQALEAPPSASFHGSDATIVGTPESIFGALSAPPAMDLEEWHISVDGATKGPLRLEALAQRIIVERAAGDQEIFIWRDGFDDWQPPREVPEVRVAVERLRPGLPANFWGTVAPLFPAVPRSDVRSTHPIDRIESFEFTDTPPTISVPRKTTAALAKELQHREELLSRSSSGAKDAPRVRSASAPKAVPMGEGRPNSGPRRAAPPMPLGEALPPAPTPPIAAAARAEIHEALSHLDEADLLSEDVPSTKSPAMQFKISEPSQMINLAQLAALRPEHESAAESVLVLPGLDLPPSTSASGVMVMTGPAPPAPGRHLKLILGAALGACVLLTGLVAYLLLRQPAGTRVERDRSGDGKAVTDRPVLVRDEAPLPASAGSQDPAAAADAAKKNGAAAKRPVKLPAAAAGKTQLNGNAEALAKLYGAGGDDKSPALPPGGGATGGASGGGVSTAELQDVMRRNQKSLSVCYERVLKHDESLRRARIDVQVRVGQTGTVTHVSIAPPYGGTELGICMQQTIRRWHFPPSDGDYETQFPLILTAS